MPRSESNEPWRYIGSVEPQRVAALVAGSSLADLTARLKAETSFLCFHLEPKDGDPSYRRAVFCLALAKRLFDLFFNAQTGYRGAYFQGAEVGLQVNRTLIDDLLPTLLQWLPSGEDPALIAESLSLLSAKMWLAEEPGLCSKCAGEWSQAYKSPLVIANGRWEIAKHTHAEWGRQAPEFSKLRVFGGFINSKHQEWIAAHKTTRAVQICEHGWS